MSKCDNCERLQHDIEAYRGALGYTVPGSHDGKLSDGTTPKCGLCEAHTTPPPSDPASKDKLLTKSCGDLSQEECNAARKWAAGEIDSLQQRVAELEADAAHREKYWAQFDHYPKEDSLPSSIAASRYAELNASAIRLDRGTLYIETLMVRAFLAGVRHKSTTEPPKDYRLESARTILTAWLHAFGSTADGMSIATRAWLKGDAPTKSSARKFTGIGELERSGYISSEKATITPMNCPACDGITPRGELLHTPGCPNETEEIRPVRGFDPVRDREIYDDDSTDDETEGDRVYCRTCGQEDRDCYCDPSLPAEKTDAAQRCQCGRYKWEPDYTQIEGSDKTLHYANRECRGSAQNTKASNLEK